MCLEVVHVVHVRVPSPVVNAARALAAARRGLGGVHALQQIHNLARSHQRERERCIRVAAAPGSQRVRVVVPKHGRAGMTCWRASVLSRADDNNIITPPR